MFSLIITIVSIVLVGALALATIYYGGDQLVAARAVSQATQIKNETQQLEAAAQLFRLDTGDWPQTLEEMVVSGHLQSIPSGVEMVAGTQGAGPVSQAFAANTQWGLLAPRQPIFTLSEGLPAQTCIELNKRGSMGVAAVARSPFANLAIQCYGEDERQLKVLSTGYPELLAGSVPDIETGTLPSGPQDSAWLIPPKGTGGTPETPEEPEQPTEPNPQASVTVNGSPASTIDFGSALKGSTAARTVTVTNSGNVALALSASPAFGLSAPFSIAQGSCSGANLGVGQSCSFSVSYSPSAIGTDSAQSLGINIGAAPGASLGVQGLAIGSIARWTPTAVSFGTRDSLSTHQLSVLVQNEGNIAGNFNLALPAGVTATDCSNVAPGGSCTMTFTYTPTAGAAYNSGALTPAGATEGANQLTVTGQGNLPPMTLSDFALQGSSCTFNAAENSNTCTVNVRNNATNYAIAAFYWGTQGAVSPNTASIAGNAIPLGASFMQAWDNGTLLTFQFKMYNIPGYMGGYHSVSLTNYYTIQELRVVVSEAGALSLTLSGPF